jgi:hypothetical protein
MRKNIYIISCLFDIGASKKTTKEIMFELFENSGKYINNQTEIDNMLLQKLDIDLYIALKYKK